METGCSIKREYRALILYPLLDFFWPIPLAVAPPQTMMIWRKSSCNFTHYHVSKPPKIPSHSQFSIELSQPSHSTAPNIEASKPGLPEDQCRRAMREVHFLFLSSAWWVRKSSRVIPVIPQPEWYINCGKEAMWGPPVIRWFIKPMNTIGTINHSYWSYKPT